MCNVMVNNSDQYQGQYVATKSFQHKDVISSGSDPVKVIQEAIGKGVTDPVVFFVPEKGMVQIF